jgi:hypothetical protein
MVNPASPRQQPPGRDRGIPGPRPLGRPVMTGGMGTSADAGDTPPGHGAMPCLPEPTRYSITVTRIPPGCALLPGQVHPRQVRPVVEDLHQAARHARPCPDQQMHPGLRIRFPQRHPGEAPSMITSIPAALPAIAIASSGSPPRNPPTLASIDEWVPVSVNVTTPGLREPRWLASGVRRPAERGPVSRRVQHQPKFCRQRARAQHRLDLDSRSPVRRSAAPCPVHRAGGQPAWSGDGGLPELLLQITRTVHTRL